MIPQETQEQRFIDSSEAITCHRQVCPYEQERWSLAHLTRLAVFLYFLWIPLSVTIGRSSEYGKLFSNMLTGCVLLAMLPCCWPYAISLSRQGVWLYRSVGLLVCAYLVAFAFNPGIQGPVAYYRYIPLRMLFVLACSLTGYYLARVGLVNSRHLSIISIIMIAILGANVAFGRFAGTTTHSYVRVGDIRIVDALGFTPPGYLLASLLVGIAFWYSLSIKYFFGGVTAILVLLTFRRGATLCVALSLVCLVLVDILQSYRIGKPKKTLFVFVVATATFLAIAWLVAAMDTSVVFSRWTDLMEGKQTSFRDELYGGPFRIMCSDPIASAFGHGFGSSVVLNDKHIGMSVYVHNDWLEIAYTAGLLAVLAFLCFHISCIRVILLLSRRDLLLLGVALIAYVNLFIAGMFQSSLFAAQESAFLFFTIGYLHEVADRLCDLENEECQSVLG